MNPSTAQARAMVVALAKHGVQDVVLAPGSRNAPLSIALAQQSVLRLHVRIDERTAGFTALGMAKASGRPVAVICTSGTAVVNLTPAVYEAHEAGVPLVLITADRPPEVRGRGANQTIEQVGVFSPAVRNEWDLPMAGDLPDQFWELAIANAVLASLGDHQTAPGPVHLNVPFAEPLVPEDGHSSWASAVAADALPSLRPVEPRDLGPLLAELGVDTTAPRGVVICSDPRSARPVTALAKMLGWPLLVEPGGGPRDGNVAIAHYARIISKRAEELEPDVVITCGRFGLNREVAALVKRAKAHLAVGRFPLAADPFATAGATAEMVPLPLGVGPAPAEWLAAWKQADAMAAEPPTKWSERKAVQLLLAELTSEDLLYVAASSPVRIVDDLLEAGGEQPRILMNRGANGIDGLIASASGAALMNPAGRTVLLIGDVAFLHDLSSLALPSSDARPSLEIVVVNNNGGAIFKRLEQGAPEFESVFDRVFGTPHGKDLAAIASALGWPAVAANSEAEFEAALRSADTPVVIAQF